MLWRVSLVFKFSVGPHRNKPHVYIGHYEKFGLSKVKWSIRFLILYDIMKRTEDLRVINNIESVRHKMMYFSDFYCLES